MHCGSTSEAWLINGDLFDESVSESAASQQLSNSDLLSCTFNRAALISGAATAALFHLIALVQAGIVLSRLVYRFHTSTRERWWSTFAARYALLVIAMAVCGVLFNCIRLISLTRGIPSIGAGSSLLALSFSPRAGGSAGLSVLLFLTSAAFIGAASYSVNNTVHAAVVTSTKGQRADGSTASLPFFIAHFTAVCMGLSSFNIAVWALLFVLPTAAQSSSSDTAQLVIALLLISLGNASYWCLAQSVTMATQRLSDSLRISASPLLPHSSGGNKPASVHPSPPAAAHGLNQAQVDTRQKQSFLFHLSSVIVRLMMTAHVLVNVALFFCCIFLPSYHLQAYWLYFAQCYWALVCIVRLHAVVVPHPN